MIAWCDRTTIEGLESICGQAARVEHSNTPDSFVTSAGGQRQGSRPPTQDSDVALDRSLATSSRNPIVRDHLFISYATEDRSLAEWLTRKLTADGYRVWCDCFSLLGGESYPR